MNGSTRVRFAFLASLTGIALFSLPASTAAQGCDDRTDSARDGKGAVRLDARAGIAVPTGDMRDYVDEGPVLGAGLSYRLAERLWVQGDWTAALMRPAHRGPLRDKGVDIPLRGSETDLHHLTGGLRLQVSDPRATDIGVRVHAGLGVTLLSTEETELAEGGDFTQFTLDGGLEIAVPLAEELRFIVRGDLYILPVHEAGPAHLGREVTLPFTGGLAVEL